MPSPQQRIGTAAETQAENLLRGKGFIILDRHSTSRFGEIDILAQDGEVIVAVEVKARSNQQYGRAAEAVTDRKIKKIAAALHEELIKREWQLKQYRIDVVTIEPTGINHIRGVGLSI